MTSNFAAVNTVTTLERPPSPRLKWYSNPLFLGRTASFMIVSGFLYLVWVFVTKQGFLTEWFDYVTQDDHVAHPEDIIHFSLFVFMNVQIFVGLLVFLRALLLAHKQAELTGEPIWRIILMPPKARTGDNQAMQQIPLNQLNNQQQQLPIFQQQQQSPFTQQQQQQQQLLLQQQLFQTQQTTPFQQQTTWQQQQQQPQSGFSPAPALPPPPAYQDATSSFGNTSFTQPQEQQHEPVQFSSFFANSKQPK